ncbi:MAG: dihydrolipoamide dehydrogenase [Alphaproteobacteria bacterium]|nr:dihydrolipoamide dehydrogenase [Alphaproteobacteria bacterium]|tara:strand:- start:3759 stop:5186 length:1428 start_codon:yes stop_codon:yes gene_type:complete
MAQPLNTDICVIGGGSGGLSVAAAASQMGAKTILIEKGKMGGDCLNYGCVPSKSLISAGKVAATIRRAGQFGIEAREPAVNFSQVHDHVHDVIASIAPLDSVERFTALGVDVHQASAKFVSPQEVDAGGTRITAKRFVIATGSAPAVPPIPGLQETPFWTNDTVFDNREKPDHLIVIGGGPIGLELAQAFRNLGSEVSVVEMLEPLAKEDPELVGVVTASLRRSGAAIHALSKVVGVRNHSGEIVVEIERDGHSQEVRGTHLIVAAGRIPNISELGLDEAGIRYSRQGIEVDRSLRTTNRRVYAIGDVAGGLQFTHVANYHAGIVIRNALFRLPAKVDYAAIPRTTYTDPELAQVGLSEEEARERHGEIRVLRWPLTENDRAHTERHYDGLVKAITTKRGRVLGAGIVAPGAGDLIQPWVLAISKQLKIGALAGMVVTYPTLSEISKRAAGSYYVPSLFGKKTRRLVQFLMRFTT